MGDALLPLELAEPAVDNMPAALASTFGATRKFAIIAYMDAALVRAACASAQSASTSAHMASTIGTARGTMHGSCLPLASSTASRPGGARMANIVMWDFE